MGVGGGLTQRPISDELLPLYVLKKQHSFFQFWLKISDAPNIRPQNIFSQILPKKVTSDLRWEQVYLILTWKTKSDNQRIFK